MPGKKHPQPAPGALSQALLIVGIRQNIHVGKEIMDLRLRRTLILGVGGGWKKIRTEDELCVRCIDAAAVLAGDPREEFPRVGFRAGKVLDARITADSNN